MFNSQLGKVFLIQKLLLATGCVTILSSAPNVKEVKVDPPTKPRSARPIKELLYADSISGLWRA